MKSGIRLNATLLRLIGGQLKPTSGTLRVDGQSVLFRPAMR